MKAYVLHNINDLRLEERALPAVPEGWELIRVHAAGICGSDIPRIYRTGAHVHPLVPGHEFAGEVVATGQKVGIFPLIPCGKCACCRDKKYEMCSNYNYLGSRCDGGFAEYAAVPKWNLLPLPEDISYEAAAMLEPMAVAVHAMRRVEPQNKTVIVCGLGTIGLLLVMLLQQAGAHRILAVGNKDFQRDCIRKLAGEEKLLYADMRTQDIPSWVAEHTGGTGADIYFECVGKNETVTQGISLVKPGGQVQLVGNPYSDMHFTRDLYWTILRHQLTITGTWNSSYTGEETDDWHYALERLGTLHPQQLITHKLPFEELEKGLAVMRDKTEDFVKIMITL